MQWEEMKRAGQTAFIGSEATRDLYQQIRESGHISLSAEQANLTQEIAEGIYPQTAAERDVLTPEVTASASDQDIEPER